MGKRGNAIITGGGGFIASHLAEKIQDKYDTIYLIDNFVRTGEDKYRNLKHLDNCISRLASNFGKSGKFIVVEEEVSKVNFYNFDNIEAVYHLAATRINRCANNPEEGHMMLADAGFNVVNYCANIGAKLFFASTASVYNNPKRFPIEESDPCEPHTIYGSAKYYTENLIRTYAKSHNLQYAICRFFSVYGARMDCEGAYTEIIFNWLNHIKKGNNKVAVYGDPDKKILDLVYVTDVVDAILKVTEDWNNDVYNVSTETGVSITDLIKTIEEALDVRLEISMVPENRTDIENKRIGSVKKLKQLGWEDKIKLKQGINKTYEWITTLEELAK